MLPLLSILLIRSRNLSSSAVKEGFITGSLSFDMQTRPDLITHTKARKKTTHTQEMGEFSRSRLVSKLQDRDPGKKFLLTVEVLRFRDGKSNILNKSSKTNVSCFWPKCLAKMKKKPFLRQCLLIGKTGKAQCKTPIAFMFFGHLHRSLKKI